MISLNPYGRAEPKLRKHTCRGAKCHPYLKQVKQPVREAGAQRTASNHPVDRLLTSGLCFAVNRISAQRRNDRGRDHLRNRIFGLLGAAALLIALAVPALGSGSAFACHEHALNTPGHTVENIASGQTSKEEGEGGYHQFHNRVHKGVPGLTAFENPNNPVSVVGAPFAATCP
jgi:hypothetical protein